MPILARIRMSFAGPKATRVFVESDKPLTIRCGDTSSPAPAEVVLREGAGGARAFVLEDARSGARVGGPGHAAAVTGDPDGPGEPVTVPVE